MTNTLVIHFSKFGNTKMVAEAIAEELGSAGPARVTSIEQLTNTDLKEIDLIVMGSPTHNMNLPKVVRPILEQLPRGIFRGIPAVAFDTSYKLSTFMARFTVAKKLARRLSKLGGKRIVPPETFHVEGREGPLYPSEIERAKKWARLIIERLTVIS